MAQFIGGAALILILSLFLALGVLQSFNASYFGQSADFGSLIPQPRCALFSTELWLNINPTMIVNLEAVFRTAD
ncbi:hypothetical protein [Mycobacteroides abscessus]|uniref:hypothetical protein n=1 Tax=Mycobacteroides abscessus TaxID=36809 RepID=UPI0010502551|nr:hypothetical protein [Mycobacteroides abscessus]